MNTTLELHASTLQRWYPRAYQRMQEELAPYLKTPGEVLIAGIDPHGDILHKLVDLVTTSPSQQVVIYSERALPEIMTPVKTAVCAWANFSVLKAQVLSRIIDIDKELTNSLPSNTRPVDPGDWTMPSSGGWTPRTWISLRQVAETSYSPERGTHYNWLLPEHLLDSEVYFGTRVYFRITFHDPRKAGQKNTAFLLIRQGDLNNRTIARRLGVHTSHIKSASPYPLTLREAYLRFGYYESVQVNVTGWPLWYIHPTYLNWLVDDGYIRTPDGRERQMLTAIDPKRGPTEKQTRVLALNGLAWNPNRRNELRERILAFLAWLPQTGIETIEDLRWQDFCVYGHWNSKDQFIATGTSQWRAFSGQGIPTWIAVDLTNRPLKRSLNAPDTDPCPAEYQLVGVTFPYGMRAAVDFTDGWQPSMSEEPPRDWVPPRPCRTTAEGSLDAEQRCYALFNRLKRIYILARRDGNWVDANELEERRWEVRMVLADYRREGPAGEKSIKQWIDESVRPWFAERTNDLPEWLGLEEFAGIEDPVHPTRIFYHLSRKPSTEPKRHEPAFELPAPEILEQRRERLHAFFTRRMLDQVRQYDRLHRLYENRRERHRRRGIPKPYEIWRTFKHAQANPIASPQFVDALAVALAQQTEVTFHETRKKLSRKIAILHYTPGHKLKRETVL